MPVNFYSNGHIRPELLSDEAWKKANEFGRRNNENNKFEGVSKTQIRKIFDEVKRLERMLSVKEWTDILPLIKMLKPKVAYQVKRAIEKEKYLTQYYKKFETFIAESIDEVKEKRDFEAFCLYFEAVYAYYYSISDKK
ncbi:hypothetical protein BREVNS_1739 [Brevinematales bacterium NS]|nr:type III-A CRISPR-associated protein Csm2 [Brevinematales bacterium]QJR22489.1 hypothetical protein BREVNS_1739 [Brevinematales bacterium NS]